MAPIIYIMSSNVPETLEGAITTRSPRPPDTMRAAMAPNQTLLFLALIPDGSAVIAAGKEAAMPWQETSWWSMTPLHRRADDSSDSEPQRKAPERCVENRQPEADSQGGANQAANP